MSFAQLRMGRDLAELLDTLALVSKEEFDALRKLLAQQLELRQRLALALKCWKGAAPAALKSGPDLTLKLKTKLVSMMRNEFRNDFPDPA
ncbi:MAG: hypothetical protein P4L56_15585 [Candidatus Sulfopaludibacter sp.]|nr:hypothetical protein [Candidatus Sulfopaludibacter sp.]